MFAFRVLIWVSSQELRYTTFAGKPLGTDQYAIKPKQSQHVSPIVCTFA